MVSCPIECVKDQPDFIERNGAWLLSVIASISLNDVFLQVTGYRLEGAVEEEEDLDEEMSKNE